MSENLDNMLDHIDEAELDLLAEASELETEAESDDEQVPEGTVKLDADYSGYMELEGAKKDSECRVVYVEGGISKSLGCCNLYHPVAGAKRFNCGACKYEKENASTD